jgi:hypothetical protein
VARTPAACTRRVVLVRADGVVVADRLARDDVVTGARLRADVSGAAFRVPPERLRRPVAFARAEVFRDAVVLRLLTDVGARLGDVAARVVFALFLTGLPDRRVGARPLVDFFDGLVFAPRALRLAMGCPLEGVGRRRRLDSQP